jgi:hypothetical protein
MFFKVCKRRFKSWPLPQWDHNKVCKKWMTFTDLGNFFEKDFVMQPPRHLVMTKAGVSSLTITYLLEGLISYVLITCYVCSGESIDNFQASRFQKIFVFCIFPGGSPGKERYLIVSNNTHW